MTTGKAAAGLDAFLNHSLDGGSGEWVKDWKDKGEFTFWIHPDSDLQHASHFTHSFFNAKTYDGRDGEPEVTKVKWYKFVCCDPDRTAGASRWYEKDGYRQNPPIVCPMDFAMEWVSVEIAAGRLDWKTPIFEFKGDEPNKDRLIRAGGMLGLFNRDDLSKDEQQELKKAGIVRREAFQQDLRSRGGYLLAVIDDAARESVQKFTIQGTGNPLKSLPGMFKARIQEVRKGYKIEDPTTGREVDIAPANPIERPYRFIYKAAPKGEGFGEYRVTSLNRKPDAQILELFALPCPDLSADRAKGNCLELRLIMEQHCVYKPLPIDSFFKAAEKAGLMKPRDEKPKKTSAARTSEVGRVAPKVASSQTSGEGNEAECVHCGGSMPSDDLTCGGCGATYDEEGDLDGIPCKKCRGVVPVNDRDGRFICEKCGAVHELDYSSDRTRMSGKKTVWMLEGGESVDDESTTDGETEDLPY